MNETNLQLRILDKPNLRVQWNITDKDQNKSQINCQMYFKSNTEVSGDTFLDELEVKVIREISTEKCVLLKGTKSIK